MEQRESPFDRRLISASLRKSNHGLGLSGRYSSLPNGSLSLKVVVYFFFVFDIVLF